MWQKARQIDYREKGRENHRGRLGLEFYTEGKPYLRNKHMRIATNIYRNGSRQQVKTEIIELLPEFAEHVDPIEWEDFVRGGILQ